MCMYVPWSMNNGSFVHRGPWSFETALWESNSDPLHNQSALSTVQPPLALLFRFLILNVNVQGTNYDHLRSLECGNVTIFSIDL